MKTLFTVISSVLLFSFINAQDCSVAVDALKGTYTGDCKKGKANGKGKAVGTDVYEGQFKGGFPDGEGVYSWKNGNRYSGAFLAGSREGFGTMLYKRPNATDSIVEGFWKNDAYVGKDEHPYRVYFKSKNVAELDVDYREDKNDKITFEITNASSGAAVIKSDADPNANSMNREGSEAPKFKVDDLELIRGAYGRLFHNDNHAKKMESVIENVTYPIRLKARINEETVEMEFRKPGSYKVSVRIND